MLRSLVATALPADHNPQHYTEQEQANIDVVLRLRSGSFAGRRHPPAPADASPSLGFPGPGRHFRHEGRLAEAWFFGDELALIRQLGAPVDADFLGMRLA